MPKRYYSPYDTGDPFEDEEGNPTVAPPPAYIAPRPKMVPVSEPVEADSNYSPYSPTVGPNAPVPSAMGQYQQALETPPKVPWWKTLAAAGLGAAAGYHNTSPAVARGRLQPIDMEGLNQDVHRFTRGSYDDRLARLRTAAAAEQQQAKTATESAKTGAETEEAKARAGLLKQQTETMAEEGKRAPKGNYIPIGKDGLFDASIGKVIREPSDMSDMIEVDPEKAKSLGLQPMRDGKYRIPNAALGQFLGSQRSTDKWQVHTTTDTDGTVWEWRTNAESGESTAPVSKGKVGKRERPPVSLTIQNKTAEQEAEDKILGAFGGDWSKVIGAGYQKVKELGGQFAPAIWKKAQDAQNTATRLNKAPADATRRLTSANTTVDTATRAIKLIDEFTKNHPNMTGLTGELATRAGVKFGRTPKGLGNVKVALESAASLQPGQHNFRSVQALNQFKQALGINPETGKSNGSFEWLKNPQKAKESLQEIIIFNQGLIKNIREAQKAAAESAGPSGALVQTPNGTVDLRQFEQ